MKTERTNPIYNGRCKVCDTQVSEVAVGDIEAYGSQAYIRCPNCDGSIDLSDIEPLSDMETIICAIVGISLVIVGIIVFFVMTAPS